jgi:hypothetical protein
MSSIRIHDVSLPASPFVPDSSAHVPVPGHFRQRCPGDSPRQPGNCHDCYCPKQQFFTLSLSDFACFSANRTPGSAYQRWPQRGLFFHLLWVISLSSCKILMMAVQRRLETATSALRVGSINYTALAMDTEGYAPADLLDLLARAIHQAVIRCSVAQQPVHFYCDAMHHIINHCYPDDFGYGRFHHGPDRFHTRILTRHATAEVRCAVG